MTNLYLFGEPYIPIGLEERLRDVPTDYVRMVSISTEQYMSTVGRFADPARASITQAFFSGEISRSLGVTDQHGVTRLTFGEYIATDQGLLHKNEFTILQYNTALDAADYKERAFIWGTTQFEISLDAVMQWDADNNLSIENMSVRPLVLPSGSDENFDFESSNSYVQFINETVLKPYIDPYDIGRQVGFEFDASSGTIYQSYTDNQYVLGLASIDVNTTESAIGSDTVVDTAGLLSAGISLVSELTMNSLEYWYDGKYIVYGSAEDNVLSSASAIYPDPAWQIGVSGFAFVAAGGDDVVTGSAYGDLVYGGAGNDVIIGAEGDDDLFGGLGDDMLLGGTGRNVIYGNKGNDTIVAGDNDVVFGGEGEDLITITANTIASGGLGNDTFIAAGISSPNDDGISFTWTSGQGSDTLQSIDANTFSISNANYGFSDVNITDVSLQGLTFNWYVSSMYTEVTTEEIGYYRPVAQTTSTTYYMGDLQIVVNGTGESLTIEGQWGASAIITDTNGGYSEREANPFAFVKASGQSALFLGFFSNVNLNVYEEGTSSQRGLGDNAHSFSGLDQSAAFDGGTMPGPHETVFYDYYRPPVSLEQVLV